MDTNYPPLAPLKHQQPICPNASAFYQFRPILLLPTAEKPVQTNTDLLMARENNYLNLASRKMSLFIHINL